ncbi:MAG: Na/Pi cotransporter family protein [Chitinispirillaceae bacterium]
MDSSLIFKMIFSVVGGLGLFLLGMKNMSEGLQTVAGGRLRKLIGMVTNQRFLAAGVGTLVTCIIQSSSITSVMAVGFVNSGLMTLQQAIGVIMGANVGTTFTGWILVLNIGKYGLPILGLAAMAFLFSKNERLRYIAMAIMGIGMVFFGLELMKNGFKPIRSFPEFEAWFHAFSADTYWGVLKCVLVGCILTLIVQSSSATLGITMGLAASGVIHFQTAAALVLGENIGTTITAYLASIGTTTNARRAAYAHIVFNVLGVIWITSVFSLYIKFIPIVIGNNPDTMVMVDGVETYPYIQAGIAAVHTGFNVANTLLFLPFVSILASLLMRIVPDKPFREPPRLTKLNSLMLDSPMVGIEQSRKEIVIMGAHNRKMLDKLKKILSDPDADFSLIKKLFHREEVLDSMQKEITVFLGELLSAGNIPHSLAEEAQHQMRVADELETLSDYVTTILKLYLRIKNAEVEFPEEMRKDLISLHDYVSDYYDLIYEAYQVNNSAIISKANTQGDAITHHFRNLRGEHLKRLSKNRVDPMLSTVFPDMLNSYRRVKDHVVNIAEVIAGVK